MGADDRVDIGIHRKPQGTGRIAGKGAGPAADDGGDEGAVIDDVGGRMGSKWVPNVERTLSNER